MSREFVEQIRTEALELFNNQLSNLMSERGMTRADLAQRLGVTTTALTFNNADSAPTLALMRKYADALGVPVWETIKSCNISAVGIPNECLAIGCTSSEDVTARISSMLKQRGMSISELSRRINVSQPTVSANMRSANISLAIIVRIAKGLNVEPWELLVDAQDVEMECQRRMNGGTLPDGEGKTSNATITTNVTSTISNAQQVQQNADIAQQNTNNVQQDTQAEAATVAHGMGQSLPLRVIRILRCPYCHRDIDMG